MSRGRFTILEFGFTIYDFGFTIYAKLVKPFQVTIVVLCFNCTHFCHAESIS